MQLIILALIFGIYLHDMLGPGEVSTGWWMIVLTYVLPKVFFVVSYGLFTKLVYNRLGTANTAGALKRLDYATNVYRLGIVGMFGVDLSMGVLVLIRRGFEVVTGFKDPVLIDELIILLVPLAMIGSGWWAYYPIDRRLREAALIRRLDQGEPVFSIWTRKQFLIAQYRNQMGMVLGPLLLLLAWTEIVFLYDWDFVTKWTGIAQPQLVVQLTGALGIFLIAPVIIANVFDTEKLPNGPIRHRLVDLCQQHGVKVRQLLLWKTYGGMINAAVMGLVGPIRYILVSDGLLEYLPQEQVDAVMAHEIAHVKKHHMFWLAMSAVALLGMGDWLFLPAVEWVWPGDVVAVDVSGVNLTTSDDLSWSEEIVSAESLAAVMTVGAWLGAFGWISRRFERQADTFAVKHLSAASQNGQAESDDGWPRITPVAVWTMVEALGNVAKFNHIPPGRRSWRHGPIAWRQIYLQTIARQRVDSLQVDKQVFLIKCLSISGTILWVGYWISSAFV